MKTRFIFALLMCSSATLLSVNSPDVPSQISAPTAPITFDTIPQRYPELSTFVMLVNRAQLKDLFSGTGPFTVFAPSNDAFKKLGEKKLNDLMRPEKRDDLSDMLIYHVIPGKYLAKNLKSKESRTINGKPLTINAVDGQITINNARVIKTDIIGPNGVIHVIDTVLIP